MPKTKRAKKRPAKSKRSWLIPYPLIILLLICVGLYLIAWTLNAHADELIVKSVTGGKTIKDPAVINSPAPDSQFTAVPIQVGGTCPAGAAYVELFRNGVMGGAALCNSGKFSLLSDLFDGQNSLQAKVFDTADFEGPASQKVNVAYSSASDGQIGLQTLPQSNGNRSPLRLTTAFVYKGYFVGQPINWPVAVSGGTPPYAMNVDWGEGRSSIVSRKDRGQFNVTHTYYSPGGPQGSFVVKVQATDSQGRYAYLEFFVIVNRPDAAAGNIYSKGDPTLGGLHEWVWLAWPIYGTVVLMVIAYKLGERQEIIILRKHRQLKGF